MPAVTDTGFVEMRLRKVVGIGSADGETSSVVVLDGVSEDRHLQIQIGQTEAFSLSCALTGVEFARPMSPRFAAPPQTRVPACMPSGSAGGPKGSRTRSLASGPGTGFMTST